MTKTAIIAALFVGAVAITVSPILAQVLPAYFDITEAEVETDDSLVEIELETVGDVPTVTGTLLGYGVLTAGGDSLIVTTSHGGVLDSAVQTSAADPVWHNHYVQLQGDSGCPVGLAGQLSVADLTWPSPGTVEVDDDEVELEDVPTGTFTLPSGTTLGTTSSTFNTGSATVQVVSFQLAGGPSGQICVIVQDIITASDD